MAAALDLLLILPCWGVYVFGLLQRLSAQLDHFYHTGPSAVPEEAVNLDGVGAALIIGVLLLQAGLMCGSGQTVGKKLLKIRVVRVDGQPCRLASNVLLRGTVWHFVGLLAAPGGFVFSMLGAVLIFGADRRCLHDLVAGTVVVQAE